MLRLVALLCIFFLYFLQAAQAASFDCSKARSPEEKFICSNKDLSAADSQLGDVYTAALARLTATEQPTLRTDERNWLKATSSFCQRFFGDNDTFDARCLLRAYSIRITYLKSTGPESISALKRSDDQAQLISNIIQKDLLNLISPSDSILESLVKRNVITPPTETTYQSYDDFMARLPAPPDAASRKAFANFLQYADAVEPIKWLPQAKLGALSLSGGSADCQVWMLYVSDGVNTRMAPVPDTLRTDLCEANGNFSYLGSFEGQPVALTESDPSAGITGASVGQVTIALQVWDGTRWSEAKAFTINLSYPLSPKPLYQSCPILTCDLVTKQSYKIADKFYHNQTAAAITEPLNQADLAEFRAMQYAANFDETYKLPDPDGKGPNYIGLPAFGQDSVVFPAHLNGALVLGRIGHGTIGWRIDNHWNVAFWRLNGAELVPVAAVVFGLGPPVLNSISNLPSWQPELH